MIRSLLKNFLKHNQYFNIIVINLLYIYLKAVYFTSRWQFIFPENYNREEFLSQGSTIFAFWHNRLVFGPAIFAGHKNIYALISPHSDGKVISQIVTKFGYKIIEGSTNKNSLVSLKIIIKKLNEGSNIVITPDGPKGPVYKINSSIANIARKYNKKLIPISCSASRYFLLKSWDQLLIPLFFSKITVSIGAPLFLTDNEEQNNSELERRLMELTKDH